MSPAPDFNPAHSESAAERRGVDLSSAPEHVRAALNRIMHLEAENSRLRADLERAVETRENANTVSVRVEAENRRLTWRLREIVRLNPGLTLPEDDKPRPDGGHTYA